MKSKTWILIVILILIAFILTSNALADTHTIWGLQGSARVFEENGRLGLMNAGCEVLHEAQFDKIDLFDAYGYARVYADGQVGMVNDKGEVIVSPGENKRLAFWPTDKETGTGVIVYNDHEAGTWIVIDADSRTIQHLPFERVHDFETGIAIVEMDGRSNLIDSGGNLLSERWFNNVEQSGSKWIGKSADGEDIFNASGRLISRCIVDDNRQSGSVEWYTDTGMLLPVQGVEDIMYLSEADVYRVHKAGLWGIVDSQGQYILPCEYDWISYKSRAGSGGFIIEKDKLYGFADRTGNIVINPEWSQLSSFTESWFLMDKDGKQGFISNDGKILLQPQWDEITWWQDGFESSPSILAQKDGETACYITETGKIRKRLDYYVKWIDMGYFELPPPGDSAYYLCFLYDKKGREREWAILEGKEGNYIRMLSRVKSKGLSFPFAKDITFGYEYIDGKGVLGNVKKGREIGFINPTGEIITNAQWQYVYDFNPYGTAFVQTADDNFRLIDMNGLYVNGTVFNSIYRPIWGNERYKTEYGSEFLNMGHYSISRVTIKGADGGSVQGYINDRGELIQRPK